MYLANSSASPESKLKNSNSDDGMNHLTIHLFT